MRGVRPSAELGHAELAVLEELRDGHGLADDSLGPRVTAYVLEEEGPANVCCTSRLDHLAGLPPDVLASGAGCPRVRGTEEERVLREGGGDGRKK